MSQPKISIIVPVYKAEAYLHRCVDSLLAQTFCDFEILLIDDGSPDKSGDICDQYSQQDDRIRVFHKENGGVSSARQLGIEQAKGEYSIHCDPDDWVEPNMLEDLYKKAKATDADIVICDYLTENKRQSNYITQHIKVEQARYVLFQLLEGTLHGSCWNKLIRHSCYRQYNISFPSNIIRWEDLFVNCELLSHNISVAYLNKAFYHYDLSTNPNSIVRKVTMQGLQSQIEFNKHFEQRFADDKELLHTLSLKKIATIQLAFYSRLLTPAAYKNLYPEVHSTMKQTYRRLNVLSHIGWCSTLGLEKYQLARTLFPLLQAPINVLIQIKNFILHK